MSAQQHFSGHIALMWAWKEKKKTMMRSQAPPKPRPHIDEGMGDVEFVCGHKLHPNHTLLSCLQFCLETILHTHTTYPADISGHARFSLQSLHQGSEQRQEVLLIQYSIWYVFTDTTERPRSRVLDLNICVVHQSYETGS